jgi:hypothetical protein
MSHLNQGFDSDLDSFLDLDQNTFTPSSASPATGKSVPSFAQRPSMQSSFDSSQSYFQGPSFQYGDYRQQTGLPTGALANTIALNQANGLQYTGNSGFVMPTETLNMPLSNLDDFDFGRNPSLDMSDMDFESDSPSDMPPMFYASSTVNPTALASQDDSPTYSAPVQRMYPGMHSQQAAQAKAQQALKQQDMLRQQQRPVDGQKSLPSSSKTPVVKDPLVEESISRLLSQMRQNSVASVDDEASTPTGSSGNGSRIKKDEEDMDEDERLLASEEGKKLSSKERRQLRNKVSARAFRSRRKEYIGQLEGELGVKAQEVNELKTQNRQLMEENTRLTDLTRMLLSSQAFSGFLSELSTSGLPAPTSVPSQTPTQPRPQSTRKDVNPHQAARQMQTQQPQIGMALIPDSAVDFAILDTPTNHWNSGLSTNDFQVFAVTDLPQGPAIDFTNLSGKSTVVPTASGKTEPAHIRERAPFSCNNIAEPIVTVNEDVVLDEEEFTLFFDSPTVTVSTVLPASVQLSCPLSSLKTGLSIELVVRHDEEDPAARLSRMCASLDATCDRLASFTSHLI